MAKFAVTPEALSELARRLQTIASQLDSTDHGVTISDPSLGSQILANTLHKFVDNWSHGRDKIIEEIHKVSKAAAAAGSKYQQTEQQITDAEAPATVLGKVRD